MRRDLSLPCVLAFLLHGLLLAQISFDPQAQQLTPPPSNTPPEQRCVIQGHVTNSQTGEPLKKVLLRLIRSEHASGATRAIHSTGAEGYSTSSQADGSFRFESVEPGDYTLSAERAGYLDTSYGAKSRREPGKILTLAAAQQLNEINLGLTRQAVISGKVLDEDGEPASDVGVQVLSAQWMRGKLRYLPTGGTSTNDLGEYRISHLGPGKYYVFAEEQMWVRQQAQSLTTPGKPDVRPVRTFYPDAVTRASATPIEISAGQDAPGIDIRLHTAATYHVRGKIAGSLPEGELDHLSISLTPRDDETAVFFFGANSTILKDLTFDMSGVAPGAYTLNLFKMGGPVRSVGRQPVDVGAADVNGVVVNIVPPISLHGQIRLEGTPSAGSSQINLSSVHVSLSATDTGTMFGGMAPASAKTDGSFTLENVSPGKYYVHASRAGDGTYLKAMRFGQEDVYGKELDLNQGSSGELEIVFRYGPAEIDGTVTSDSGGGADSQNAAQSLAAPAEIVLVPEAMNADGSGIRQSSSDRTGAFSMKQVPPGRYRAYALEQLGGGEFQDPELRSELQSKSVEVDVKENDKKQIQLSLISAEEFQQLLARLGIEAQ